MMTADAEPGSEKMEKGTLRHVVMFKFKDSSSDSDVQSVVDAFRALPKRIPEIADFEYGTNNSPEGLNEGLTHCFLVSFKSEEDREKYLPHPAHKEFVGVLKPHLDKVVVIDYWADK
ncbi:Dabb family protein [Crateriforma conspicua]